MKQTWRQGKGSFQTAFMSPSIFDYIKVDLTCPLLLSSPPRCIPQRTPNQASPVFLLCVLGSPIQSHGSSCYLSCPFQILTSSLVLLMLLSMKYLSLDISQLSLFHHVQHGTHHLSYFLYPSSRTAGSFWVHFRKYYQVVKLSTVRVIFDSLVQSVINFFNSTS